MRMAFIIIETKQPIQNYKNVILDILSKNLSLGAIEETTYTLIIQTNHDETFDKEIFLGLAEELYADLRVYMSQPEPNYSRQVIEAWFKMIPFNKTAIYDDRLILLRRIDYPINNEVRKLVLKSVFEDNELLYTIKTYLETNQ